MGVRGAICDQLQRPVSWLKKYSRGITYSLVGLGLWTVAAPLAAPALTVKSPSTVVAAQQLPELRNWATGAVVVGGFLKEAQDELEAERESVTAEQQAFHEFAERVQSLSTPTHSGAGADTARLTDTGTGRQQLKDVQKSYRETVMSVPNYETEYGESLEEHLAAEFSPDVASVILDGHQFTQPVKQMLVQQARQSARRRDPLVDAIAAEENSLAEANSNLETTDELIGEATADELATNSIGTLVAADATIQQASDRCERLLSERQREIHRMNTQFSDSDTSFFQEYLYKRLDYSFPVLNATIERLRTLRRRRSALIREITRRE